MRQINLPAFNTISFTMEPAELAAGAILMPDGLLHRSMGSIGPEQYKALEMARVNGGTILWSTVCLEQTLGRIISNFLFGAFDGPSPRRQFFEDEMMHASFFSFNVKKELVARAAEKGHLLTNKERGRLQRYLKQVMSWRNAFAHGNLKLDSKKGVLLSYYSGRRLDQQLDDEFWNEVELVYGQCHALTKQLETLTAS